MPGPDTTIWDMEVAMAERPRGAEFIVSGDLKVDLYKTGGQVWDEEIAAVVVMAGL